MLGGQCSIKTISWRTTLLFLAVLLAAAPARGWSTLANLAQEEAPLVVADDSGSVTVETKINEELSCAAAAAAAQAAAPTVSHFNLVVEPQFGGGGISNKRCKDRNAKCVSWSQNGECLKNPVFMLVTCSTSCRSCLSVTGRYGVEQVVQAQSDVLEEYLVTQRMHDYMIDVVYQDDSFENVKHTCRNQDKDCVHWAAIGECEKVRDDEQTINWVANIHTACQTHTTSWKEFGIHDKCAPACRTCHIVDFNARCPNASTTTSPSLWTKAGDLNSFFELLLAESRTFRPTVHSIPATLLKATGTIPGVTIAPTVAGLGDGPWVVTLENFFDASECNHLIEQGRVKGYERSTDVGGMKADGTFDKVQSTRRTSTNTWCSGDCFRDVVVQDMTKKLEALLHVPTNYTEHWQLLRYEVGQEYKEHHDFVRQQVTRAEGPRIFTVFFYLNTVTDGGGTQFPALNNLTINPEQGRVLIWPSVLDENPDEPDTRTNHRALPVGEGTKYGANAWIHQRDYKTPQSEFCV